ncbi:uncharacterized protein LOC110943614 [Helianthus annuus]|uniref:uncharacterized protein LOC110943614 n=1 Tax=Helianthus annuus TaxID=4232 RepID=UPI0016533A94|nr:uncharacterized protein LOC110943614 [Helianthus annuus]
MKRGEHRRNQTKRVYKGSRVWFHMQLHRCNNLVLIFPRARSISLDQMMFFSKVMGNDRNGDAVIYGLGVRAADVWGVIPSHSACHRENIQLKSQCEELTSTVVQLRAQVLEMEGSRGGSSVQPLASQHFPNVTNGHQRLRVRDEVFLKSILNSTDTVARGRVQSLDPMI